MGDFRIYLNELLKDEEFRKGYEALEPEYNAIREQIYKDIAAEQSIKVGYKISKPQIPQT